MAMRLIGMALLLAAAPAPGGGARVPATKVAAPKVIGPDATREAYASVPIATLRPMLPEEIRLVLTRKHSDPGYDRVPTWYQRNGHRRALAFGTRMRASDGLCDPAACAGKYAISGNGVSVDFSPRGGVVELRLFVSPDGTAYVTESRGPLDGRASPW